jgi:hypothetical protein
MTRAADLEQAERRKHVGSTGNFTSYRDRAFAEMALEAHGRHAAAAKATVVGKAPTPVYPRQPSGSPWAGEVPESIEPPLGYSVQDDIEPTGNYHEIQESLIAASVAIPSSDAVPAREDVDATPPQRAVPSGGFVSPSEGTSPSPEPGLRRGWKL